MAYCYADLNDLGSLENNDLGAINYEEPYLTFLCVTFLNVNVILNKFFFLIFKFLSRYIT